MPNVRFIVEYDGRGFHGWQRQPGVRTVQAEFERALGVALGHQAPATHASGRTDSGVHARGQVVTVQLPETVDLERMRYAISSLLRPEVSVLAVDRVPDEFHARKSALKKRYCYRILNRHAPPALDFGQVWHVRRALDVARLEAYAQVFVGQHDFVSFRSSDCNARHALREIFTSRWLSCGEELHYRVEGSGFLKQMVRIMVGTMLALEREQAPVAELRRVLSARDRTQAGPTAPAYGLVLEKVFYAETPGAYSEHS